MEPGRVGEELVEGRVTRPAAIVSQKPARARFTSSFRVSLSAKDRCGTTGAGGGSADRACKGSGQTSAGTAGTSAGSGEGEAVLTHKGQGRV